MKLFKFTKANMPPIVKGFRFHSFDSETDGKKSRLFLFRCFSAPKEDDLYLVSQFFLSEKSMRNLKSELDQIAQEEPKVFESEDTKGK